MHVYVWVTALKQRSDDNQREPILSFRHGAQG